jgi:hypothetical protein
MIVMLRVVTVPMMVPGRARAIVMRQLHDLLTMARATLLRQARFTGW